MPAPTVPSATFTPPIVIIKHQRKGWLLSTEMHLPQRPDDVFPFFADAGNLESLTPPYLRFRILTPPPIQMKKGATIEYKLRLHGLPIHWITEITEWDPPFRFVDTQVQGPYRWWVHEHRFLVENDGTTISDRVRYHMPFGRILHPLFVKRDLTNIFQYRARIMHQRFVESAPALIHDDAGSSPAVDVEHDAS